MRNGKLRNRGDIKELGTTLTSRGQREDTVTTVFADVPYSKRDVSGGEIVRGRQVASEATCRLTMHYLPGITTKMRLVDGDHTYEFIAIRDPHDNRRELEIDAREIT